ncbi:hypothetical protein V8F33_000379 [Rhypophila sp. PSN 637]
MITKVTPGCLAQRGQVRSRPLVPVHFGGLDALGRRHPLHLPRDQWVWRWWWVVSSRRGRREQCQVVNLSSSNLPLIVIDHPATPDRRLEPARMRALEACYSSPIVSRADCLYQQFASPEVLILKSTRLQVNDQRRWVFSPLHVRLRISSLFRGRTCCLDFMRNPFDCSKNTAWRRQWGMALAHGKSWWVHDQACLKNFPFRCKDKLFQRSRCCPYDAPAPRCVWG